MTTLELLSAVASVAAIVALVISLSVQAHRIDLIQKSRVIAAEDSCHLLRGLVLTATPKGREAHARAYLEATPLANCVRYGRRITHLPQP